MGKLSVKIILLMLVTLMGWAGSVEAVNVTVTTNGAGSGAVARSPAGAACTPVVSGCSSYTVEPLVTLTATANPGSTFAGWSGGGCSGTLPSCDVDTTTTDQNVTATFTTNYLNISTNGTGTGAVTRSPVGVACVPAVSTCGAYATGDLVTLTATPGSGSIFSGWSGGGCSGLGSCTVSMTTDQNVTATFTSVVAITVINEGSGSDYGQVTSSPAGITCWAINSTGGQNTDCSEGYLPGTGVDLVAQVNAVDGAFFAGWTVEFLPVGAITYVQQTNMCLGLEPTCHVTVPVNVSDIRVRAKYDLGFILTLQRDGSGSGTITASSVDYQQAICTSTLCTQTYSKLDSFGNPRVVTLIATQTNTSKFKEWQGACTGTDPNVCSVTMDQARAVTAVFDPVNPSRYDLTLIKEGSGSDNGIVVSVGNTTDPVNCGGSSQDCTGNFAAGQGITLNAMATGDATFSRWQVYFLNNDEPPKFVLQPNMCTGLEPTCAITMASYAQVRAQFDLGFILTVVRDGSGTGSVVSNSPDLDACASGTNNICSQTFNKDKTVILTAVPKSNSRFAGWTGASCQISGANNEICTIIMSEAKLVKATFHSTANIVVTTKGAGLGTITSDDNPRTIKCSNDPADTTANICAADFTTGQGITLTAASTTTGNPATNSRFIGWGGACISRGASPTCSLTVSTTQQLVEAYFELVADNTSLLNVNKNGGGTGKVISFPTGIDCGTDCYEKFANSTKVTLLAITDPGSQFTGWTGACTGVALTCDVTLTQASSVTATFEVVKENTNLLTVNTKGSGKVVSSPSGIDCGSTCLKTFPDNSVVTLQALPDSGSRFTGWSGACSGSSFICNIALTEAASAIANFETVLSMTVNKTGTGLGRVASDVSGIDCGTKCTFDFPAGTGIRLTATPEENSRFKGWTGACSSSGAQPVCSITVTGAAQLAGAEFEIISGPLLTITKNGTGSGSVASSDGVINCGSVCKENFAINNLVTLIAKADAGSSFVTWGGVCSNRVDLLTCNVTMDQAKSVSATFNKKTSLLTVAKEGSGTGDIVSAPAGISCGETCTGSFGATVPVALTVTPSPGSVFSGWSGACIGQALTCYVTMDQAQNVTAKFSIANQLSVALAGDGFGTVISNPGGISCDGTCSAAFLKDTAVTLTANAIGGSQFTGWGGACSGTKVTCLVTLKSGQNVTATFQWIGTTGLPKPVGKLNDTGIDWCANNSALYIANKENWCGSLMSTHPYQDGQDGRDMYARQGLLTKLGKGDAGFDYTKVCNNGQIAGEGTCPQAPVLGGADTDWGCTRDNVTNLIWEVKTIGGLRDKDALYTWYESNDVINGGEKGDNCAGINCNTESFVAAVNQQGLCGANDWRMPTRHELHSIAHQGRSKPSIDITLFPNTAANGYWTATPVAAHTFNAWYVNFEYGWDYWDNKSNQQRVRLVRVCLTCEDNTPVSSPVFSNGNLSLPVVNVDGQLYSAKLKMLNSNPLTFGLSDVQSLNKKAGRSASGDQVRYYPDDQRAVVGGVVVGDSRYNATLQLVPGTNPVQFVVSGARLVQ